MKRILITILSVIMLCSIGLFTLTACDGCASEKVGEKPQTSVETFIDISLAEKSMIVGDETTLVASHPMIEGKTVAWSSSDDSIATVVNGVVTAVRPGTATVTATFEDKSDTCEVTVGLGSYIPTIVFENAILNDALNVARLGEVNLGAYVKFNNKSFYDATFEYTVKNTSLGSVDQAGKFTAGSASGTTIVEVKADWRGIESPELTRNITVKVISNSLILVDQGKTSAIELYTVENFAGQNYSVEKILEGNLTASEDGVDKLSSLQISVTDNVAGDGSNDVAVNYEPSTMTLSANKHGTANLNLSFATVDNSTYSVVIPITVKRPTTEYGPTIQNFSAMDGALDVDTIFGASDTVLIDAYQNGNDVTGTALTVTDNNVLGVSLTNLEDVSEETITVYSNQVGYVLNLEAYTKVIDEDSDLSALVDADATEKTIIKGYFILANNIEHSGTWNGNIYNEYSYFGGVFDGKGYNIDLQLGTGGLFSGLTTFATIKNVAVSINNKASVNGNGDTNAIFAKKLSTEGNAKQIFFSDVFVDVNVNACTKSNTNMMLIAQSISNVVTYTNVIFDFADGVLTVPAGGAGSHDRYGPMGTYFATTHVNKDGEDITGDGTVDKKYNYEENFVNTYYINKDFKYLGGFWNSGVFENLIYAANDGEFMANEQATPVAKAYVPTIYRYDDYAAMANAELDLTSFNPLYWDTSSGVPVFKNANFERLQMATSLTLNPGVKDSATIGMFTTNSGTPVWTSDSNVITVDQNGVVTAVSVGTANVTVTVGSDSATCVVTSAWANNTAPVVSVEDVTNDKYFANYSENKTFVPALNYNGSTVSGLTFTWSSTGDISIDSATGAFVAPNNYAAGTITATTTYYGVAFSYTFDVEVATDPAMQVNGEDPAPISLYSDATWGGDNETEAEFTVTHSNSVTLSSIVSNDTDVVTYDNARLIAVGAGETTITVTFSDGTSTFTRLVNVTVERPVKAVTAQVDYSYSDGKLYGLKEAFEESGEVTVVAGMQGETALTVENGTVTGITGINSLIKDSVEVTLYIANKGITVTLNTYTKIISTDSDLSVLVDADATAKTIVTGYYVLANDIERSGTWNGNTLNNNSYFGGTFDGNGHYIDLQLGTGGLFSGLATNATIKNVAILINNQSTAGKVDDARFILSKNASNSGNNLQIYISDVYVDVNVDATNGSANMSMIASAGSWVISYNNVVIDFADGVITPTKAQVGVFATYLNDNCFKQDGDYYKYESIGKASDVGKEFNNTYYINGNNPIYVVRSGRDTDTGKHFVFADNDTELMASASVGEGNKKVYLPGVKRYDDYTAMAAANCDLTSFNSECWDTTAGYPVWKACQASN